MKMLDSTFQNRKPRKSGLAENEKPDCLLEECTYHQTGILTKFAFASIVFPHTVEGEEPHYTEQMHQQM